MDGVDGAISMGGQLPAWTSSIPSNITSTYNNVAAAGNSSVHNGHVFHFHQHCTVQHHLDDVAKSSSQATLRRQQYLTDLGTNPRTREAQETLDTVLKKLGKLSLSVQHCKEGEGAEKIARRIAAVFDALVNQGHKDKWDKRAERQLEKLRASVKWEEQFDINSVPKRKTVKGDAKAKAQRIFVQIGNWDISLTTTTVDSRRENGLHDMDLSSTLRVEPQHESSGSPLAVFFSEYTDGHVRSTINPKVLAYNTVSDDAEVFDFVQQDDLDSLSRLLASGKASIRDCDESGRSLLHYSCRMKSARCCSFLVSCGVDVDRFELEFPGARGDFEESPPDPSAYMTPMQVLTKIDFEPRDSSCMEILSHAGADPTITEDHDRVPSPFVASLTMRNHILGSTLHTFLHTFLRESSPYVDFEEKFDGYKSYWLELFLRRVPLEDPTLIRMFAEKGANVAEVDKHGFNCLFLFTAKACEPGRAREYQALRHLLAVFNDIYALDAKGNDIFAYVNEIQNWPAQTSHRFDYTGSYQQDLWYIALKESKLDVRYGVQPCTRIARYTAQYTPKHYLALCYLDDWNSDDETGFEKEIGRVLLEHPLSEDEKRIQKKLDAQNAIFPVWESDSGSAPDLKDVEV